MLITLREFQKKVLELLLDKYEDSKTYAGENRVSQRIYHNKFLFSTLFPKLHFTLRKLHSRVHSNVIDKMYEYFP